MTLADWAKVVAMNSFSSGVSRRVMVAACWLALVVIYFAFFDR
jgi:hypothetical protein